LALKLAHSVSSSLGFDDEKEAVIAYGLIAVFQTFLTLCLVFIFGLLIGVPVEALIVCFTGSFLRKYSGGAHAKTAELCTAFSVLYCAGMAAVSRYLLTPLYHPVLMAAAAGVVFILAFIAVHKFAPVDSPNKPIRTEAKKRRMRKGSFTVLVFYFVVLVFLLILAFSHKAAGTYMISMLFGLGWQVFTLTHPGAQFIGVINTIADFGKEVRR